MAPASIESCDSNNGVPIAAESDPQEPHESTAAASTFFGLPELVEAMLLHLPLPQILRVQKVNKSWNTIIKSSPNLQKALFFRPSVDVAFKLPSDSPKPLECTSAENCDFAHSSVTLVDRTLGKQSFLQIRDLVVNPLMAASGRTYYSPTSSATELTVYDFSAIRGYSAGSWKYMFITQPPLKEMVVSDGSAAHLHVWRAKAGSLGITWGDLLDTQKSFLRDPADYHAAGIPYVMSDHVDILGNRDAARFVGTDRKSGTCRTFADSTTTAAGVLQIISDGPGQGEADDLASDEEEGSDDEEVWT